MGRSLEVGGGGSAPATPTVLSVPRHSGSRWPPPCWASPQFVLGSFEGYFARVLKKKNVLPVQNTQVQYSRSQTQGLQRAARCRRMRKNWKSKEARVASFPQDHSAKEGGQLVTALTGGHGGWHSVRPCACHLSLGLLQEPSNWSLRYFLLHPPAGQALRLLSTSSSRSVPGPGRLPERARVIKAPSLPVRSSKSGSRDTHGSRRCQTGATWGTEDTDSGTSSPATHQLSCDLGRVLELL